MKRVVVPEWLDGLPATDEGAQGSRRDLERLNSIMGHAGVFTRLWKSAALPAPDHLAELGAGDGTLCLKIMRRLPADFRPRRVTLIDRQSLVSPATRNGFAALGCEVHVSQMDVFKWLNGGGRADVLMANLFLHHFQGAELRQLLGGAAASARMLLAVEPRRSRVSHTASRCLGMIGCNAITRHDAVVSVEAGFAGSELSALWPHPAEWTLLERPAGLFSHAFLAARRAAS